MKNHIMHFISIALFIASCMVLVATMVFHQAGCVRTLIAFGIYILCIMIIVCAGITINYYEYMIRRSNRLNRNKH